MRACTAYVFLIGCCIAAEPDNVAFAKLDDAKREFHDTLTKLRAGVLEALDAQEEALRAAGDKPSVDRLIAQRIAFEKNGTLPTVVLTTAYRKGSEAARRSLLTAYDDAIKECVRTSRDKLADVLERERRHLTQTGVLPPAEPPARTKWVAKNGRKFEAIEGNNWQETPPAGKKAEYVKVAESPDYVELRRTDGHRVRLHTSVFYWSGHQEKGVTIWKESPADESRGEWTK